MKLRKAVQVLGFFLLVLLTFWAAYYEPNPVSSQPGPPTKSIGDIISASMEPTLKVGTRVIIDTAITPKETDIISFICLDLCYFDDGDDNNGHYDRTTRYAKRLIDIREDGAWWVEGDNKEDSWDSRSYGWILPENRTDVGVVVEILE